MTFCPPLPKHLEAHSPPEARGLARDEVRLLVTRGDNRREHARFLQLPDFLNSGDLLVVNDSATLPAAFPGRSEQGQFSVHFSGLRPDGRWLVEPRHIELKSPEVELGDVRATLEPYTRRLWSARLAVDVTPADFLSRHGQPIRYPYVTRPWPLSDYQSHFAARPGSSEMPSAGRPFSERVVSALADRGVRLVSLTLHTGVSSLESDEEPYPEWYEVPAAALTAIARTRQRGGRVIAVGTTVLRALETAVRGQLTGWTTHIVKPEHSVTSVDGLLTGLHEPRSTHLWMLHSLMSPDLLTTAYDEALQEGYLWHEFGDSHLHLRS